MALGTRRPPRMRHNPGGTRRDRAVPPCPVIPMAPPSPVLRLIQLPNQPRRVPVRHPTTPVAHGHRARGGGHAAAVHPSERRLHGHRHHRARGLGIEPGYEGLIDPAARERHAVGDRPDEAAEVAPHDASAHRALARPAVAVLLLDPMVGFRQPVLQRRVRLPAEDPWIIVLSLFRPATPRGAVGS